MQLERFLNSNFAKRQGGWEKNKRKRKARGRNKDIEGRQTEKHQRTERERKMEQPAVSSFLLEERLPHVDSMCIARTYLYMCVYLLPVSSEDTGDHLLLNLRNVELSYLRLDT